MPPRRFSRSCCQSLELAIYFRWRPHAVRTAPRRPIRSSTPRAVEEASEAVAEAEEQAAEHTAEACAPSRARSRHRGQVASPPRGCPPPSSGAAARTPRLRITSHRSHSQPAGLAPGSLLAVKIMACGWSARVRPRRRFPVGCRPTEDRQSRCLPHLACKRASSRPPRLHRRLWRRRTADRASRTQFPET